MKGKVIFLILLIALFIIWNIGSMLFPTPVPFYIQNIQDITITPNENISFDVGEKFEYVESNYIGIIENGHLNKTQIDARNAEENIVEEVIEIDGKEYFVITNVKNISGSLEAIGYKIFTVNSYPHQIFYYDHNGKKMKNINENFVNDIDEKDFFAYWMLGLEDNKSFEIRFTTLTETNNAFDNVWLFKVVKREDIGGVECFKVEKISFTLQSPNEKTMHYYWIDSKKRILIKMERWGDDMKWFEKKLINA